MSHLFRDYPRASEFWKEATNDIYPFFNDSLPFNDWVNCNMKLKDPPNNSSSPMSTVFAYSMWGIWLRINMWVFKKESKSISSVWKKTLWLAKEFSNIGPIKRKPPCSVVLEMVKNLWPYFMRLSGAGIMIGVMLHLLQIVKERYWELQMT